MTRTGVDAGLRTGEGFEESKTSELRRPRNRRFSLLLGALRRHDRYDAHAQMLQLVSALSKLPSSRTPLHTTVPDPSRTRFTSNSLAEVVPKKRTSPPIV